MGPSHRYGTQKIGRPTKGRRRGQHWDHGGLPFIDLATMARILVTPALVGTTTWKCTGGAGVAACPPHIKVSFHLLVVFVVWWGGHRPGIPKDRGGNVPEYRQYEHNNSDNMRGRDLTFDI